MSDLGDTIQESVNEAKDNPLNSRVAIFVAITATFMALCNVKDGNVVQAMSQAQAHGIDAWSYFQAKSTKQSIAEDSLEMIQLENRPGADAIVQKYKETIARYEKEKLEIKAQAEGFEKEYEAINVFDDQFDMTEAFLSIAVAMFGITALTQKTWLFYFSCLLSAIGITCGLAAFLHISLHSDFVSKVLG